MSRAIRRHQDEDDEVFDGRGVLRDGARWRVPMSMQDSLQRDVAEHFSRPRVVDGQGGDGLSLSRPGFRRFDSSATTKQADDSLRARDAREDAYRAYDAWVTSQWKGKRKKGADFHEDVDDPVQELRDVLRQKGYGPEDIEAFIRECTESGEGFRDLDVLVRQFERDCVGSGYENPPRSEPRTDAASVATMMRDHQQRMARLYEQRDRELQDEWRRNK